MPDADTDLTIPLPLAAEIQAAADDEQRPAVDILREAFESYQEARRWRLQAEQETLRAQVLGLVDDETPLTNRYRQTFGESIDQGLKSARSGKLVDGDAVFARINGELDELERLGCK